MTTNGEAIKHLWTHKTQNHPWLADEELVIDRAEGVWVWTERGHKLLDGFAGLAVVNVGHGRREIAEAIAEQTVRLAYYPTTRQFSNRPAAELATKLASLTPGDLEYTMFAVSGSEANERAMQMARHYWLAKGKSGKYKVISLTGGYHGATAGTYAICGLPHMVEAYAPLQVPGFAKVTPPYPYRDRGTGTDAELVQRRVQELRETIQREGPDTVSAVIMEPVISSGGYIPLSAAIARRKLADAFPEDGQKENVHPNTYAAHPVACAAGLANLQIMEKDHLVENAEAMGTRLLEGLRQAVGKNRLVGEVRGRGLMVCVELVEPDGSGHPLHAD